MSSRQWLQRKMTPRYSKSDSPNRVNPSERQIPLDGSFVTDG